MYGIGMYYSVGLDSTGFRDDFRCAANTVFASLSMSSKNPVNSWDSWASVFFEYVAITCTDRIRRFELQPQSQRFFRILKLQ
jgi:hypothetical protein